MSALDDLIYGLQNAKIIISDEKECYYTRITVAHQQQAAAELTALRAENGRMLDCYATYETILGNGDLGVDIRDVIKAEAEARADNQRLREALTKYDEAIKEAEAILGGEYAMHYGPFFEMVEAARAALKAES
jgi:hypothetical protein